MQSPITTRLSQDRRRHSITWRGGASPPARVDPVTHGRPAWRRAMLATPAVVGQEGGRQAGGSQHQSFVAEQPLEQPGFLLPDLGGR